MSLPKEKLLNLLPEVDEDTAKEVLDFMEYLLEKKKSAKNLKAKGIKIEPLPTTKPWPKDLIINREDAYSEYRGL